MERSEMVIKQRVIKSKIKKQEVIGGWVITNPPKHCKWGTNLQCSINLNQMGEDEWNESSLKRYFIKFYY